MLIVHLFLKGDAVVVLYWLYGSFPLQNVCELRIQEAPPSQEEEEEKRIQRERQWLYPGDMECRPMRRCRFASCSAYAVAASLSAPGKPTSKKHQLRSEAEFGCDDGISTLLHLLLLLLCERLSVEYHPGEAQNVPRLVKLGMVTDPKGTLARQDSSMSIGQRRDSSCSVTSFVSATSSRLKGAYAQQRDLSKKQPHIGELFAGNQFLLHLAAVPPTFASPCEHADIIPSSGFLDASLRCREADLKDRIILFL